MVADVATEQTRSVGLHALPVRAAQQRVDRLLLRFAHDVPQGDVDGADAGGIHTRVVQCVPNHFVIKGVLAHHIVVDGAARGQ